MLSVWKSLKFVVWERVKSDPFFDGVEVNTMDEQPEPRQGFLSSYIIGRLCHNLVSRNGQSIGPKFPAFIHEDLCGHSVKVTSHIVENLVPA